jgi:gluconokinase
MEYVIGLDIGTTHCKAVAMSVQGHFIQQLQAGYPTIQHIDGQSEQDPEVIFNTVIELLQKTISSVTKEHQLKSIAFSSAMHSILAVEKNGKPLTNAFTWADTRSEEFAKKLLKEGKQTLLYSSIGVPIHPMLPLCKIIWIKDSMPEVYSRTTKFISIKEYVFYKLFGKYIIDYSIASASGLFNINTLIWSDEALSLAGISREFLSEPVPVIHGEVEMKKEYRDKLRLSDNVTYYIGGSDGCLANIGSGATGEGEGAVTIGTSGAIRIVTKTSRPDPQERLFNYVVQKNFFVCGGPVNNGGIVLKWFAENFLDRDSQSSNDFDWFLKEASKVQVGSNGLVFLPFLLGERAPYWDATLRGAFVGLDIRHTKKHMMRAVVEGICFGLCSVMKATEETYGKIHTLYASGGFTQSAAWLQMLCDILNKKILIAGKGDASALGAAFIALYAGGYIKDFTEAKRMIPIEKEFEPNSNNHSAYKQQFAIFESLVPKIKIPLKSSMNS